MQEVFVHLVKNWELLEQQVQNLPLPDVDLGSFLLAPQAELLHESTKPLYEFDSCCQRIYLHCPEHMKSEFAELFFTPFKRRGFRCKVYGGGVVELPKSESIMKVSISMEPWLGLVTAVSPKTVRRSFELASHLNLRGYAIYFKPESDRIDEAGNFGGSFPDFDEFEKYALSWFSYIREAAQKDYGLMIFYL